MRLLSRAAAAIPRVNWRSRENLLRLTLFLAVVGVIVAAFLLHSRITAFQIFHLGYLGVGLSALLASGGLIVPVPVLAAACVASLFLFPLLVGIIAGTAEAIGELTGYFLGYSGRGIVRRNQFFLRTEGWMRRRGWLLLLALSAIPNPVFDVVGITAGALRYPLWSFLGVVLVGKLIKFIALSYACAFSIEWFTQLFL
jgi:membrane protein YqaA with SNARE-associated domain